MNDRDIILKKARKNKKFIRLLKEIGLYKRYFHMLEKHGSKTDMGHTHSDKMFTQMRNYLFYGFTWIDDEKITPAIWGNLYDIIEKYDTNIRKSKTIPLTELKNNEEWRCIETTLKLKQ